jgi:predicted transcriptional regulator
MVLKKAEEKFIAAWGAIGTQWGINRTMAQIHALLLISEKSLSAEEIMSKLNISRGNVNMNVRDLMSWGLVHKVLKFGERKEFFTAEKDIYKTAGSTNYLYEKSIFTLLYDKRQVWKLRSNQYYGEWAYPPTPIINIESVDERRYKYNMLNLRDSYFIKGFQIPEGYIFIDYPNNYFCE